MTSSAVEPVARAQDVRLTRDELIVGLRDGRTVSVPLAWFPRLLHATEQQRSKWRFVGDGEGIHWPAIDEDLSVAGLLAGTAAPASTSPTRPRSNSRMQPTAGGRRKTKPSRRESARRG